MIEFGIYYLAGLAIALPVTSYIGTRTYYKSIIYKLEKELWKKENTREDITTLINSIEEKELTFIDKKQIIQKFFDLNSNKIN